MDPAKPRGPWPEQSASPLSQLTFSYLTPLLRRGARETLAPEDLWPPSAAERVATLRGGGLGRFREALKTASFGLLRRAGFWQLIVSAGQLAQPLVVRGLVLAVSEGGAKARNDALRVTGYIALLTVVQAFAQQRRPGPKSERVGAAGCGRVDAAACGRVDAARWLRRRRGGCGRVDAAGCGRGDGAEQSWRRRGVNAAV